MNNNFPLVSVIIPCYNQAQYLPYAINCLLQQTYINWECIIVNDGSTDKTEIIANDFILKDNRIRLINQVNKGLSSARNTGLDDAKGLYIQFLDADDEICKNKLSLQLELIDSITELSLSITDFYRGIENNIDSSELYSYAYLPPWFTLENPIYDLVLRWETELSIPIHCFLFDSRFFIDKKIRFDESLPTHEDWDCWMQIFSYNPTVKLIYEPLAFYRLHQQSMCTNKYFMWKGFDLAINKQKKLNKNKDILNTLKIKQRKTKKIYKETILQKFFLWVLYKYEKIIPWRIKQFIKKNFEL